ncbi:Zinc-type alcohol dehydrogenase superfamily protein [Penicillium ucsense]|uniref:Zinc-type alcohol dehydrogenase superfamily protein n=1 Tax=Penicillium ucsense TaxID=2839758 RepID=A0A8J8W470_9EURO|nr:Zinc-type alcohol dehydrogenase superfamily protein [Penicillium ucsense]KAF7735412.1 Zinc-type alcohol dehydrogenase superfamily protein [Penicillium ucsense]
MLSIHISDYATPEKYEVGELAAPVVESPQDVIIKVHAASVNPIDVKKAAGASKVVLKDSFPYKIGYDCAGTVVEVGSQVSRVKVGDEVYTRLPECHRGAWSELAKTTEDFVALKPTSLSMEDAASIPLTAMTALQALRRYPGDLAGKTVFVPAGLSGTGLFACQLAKNVFKAGKVITTVSTAKVARVSELLGDGVVDEIIDYTKQDPKTVIPSQSIDFLFDTMGDSMNYLMLMRPKGAIVTISILTSGDVLQNSGLMRRSPDKDDKAIVPFPVRVTLNLLDRIRTFRASRYGVEYSAIFLEPNAQDLNSLREWIDAGKLRTVVGNIVSVKDAEAVRKACQVVYDSKGGVGKSVIGFV